MTSSLKPRTPWSNMVPRGTSRRQTLVIRFRVDTLVISSACVRDRQIMDKFIHELLINTGPKPGETMPRSGVGLSDRIACCGIMRGLIHVPLKPLRPSQQYILLRGLRGLSIESLLCRERLVSWTNKVSFWFRLDEAKNQLSACHDTDASRLETLLGSLRGVL